MRLVLVVPRFPLVSETFIVNKFVGLIDIGWDAHIACMQAYPEHWDEFPALTGRHELRDRVHREWPHEARWMAVLLWFPVLLLTVLRAPRATRRYWRECWPRFGRGTLKRFYLDAPLVALQPDILHFEFGALAVERLYLKEALGCRLSVSFRGYDLNYVGLDDPEYYSHLWQAVDGVHVLGRDLWRRALNRGCPPEMPHALIPPAIDVDYFSRSGATERDATRDTEWPLRILSVGRLEWKKGYEYALDAARLLAERGHEFEYRIIGDGAYLEPLAFMRHEAGLENRVRFLGAQPHAQVLDAMNWADVLLHASVSEGFCNAVLEAQAMGLPVVVSDADGLPENVDDGRTGFVVPRREPVSLAEKLAVLAGDSNLRREMGAAGRARVENCFSLPRQIADFDRFYSELKTRHAH